MFVFCHRQWQTEWNVLTQNDQKKGWENALEIHLTWHLSPLQLFILLWLFGLEGHPVQVTQSRSFRVTVLSVWPSDVSHTPLVAWCRRLVFTVWMEIVHGDRWRQVTASQQLSGISRRVNAQLLRESESMMLVRESDRYEDRQIALTEAENDVLERKNETDSIVLMFTHTLPAHLLAILQHAHTHNQILQLNSYTLQLTRYEI